MDILIATLHVRPSAQAIPLAAGCLKASLPTDLQQQTKLIDLFPETEPTLLCQQLLDLNPAIIAFPLYVWNRKQLVMLSLLLRQKRPDLILLAGGPEAGADCHKLIREGAFDAVIRGEGEASFAALIMQLSAGKLPIGLAGFLSATQKSAIIPPAAVCTDLAALSSPWLTGQIPLQRNGSVLWEVARGCRFNCAFCYDAKGHQGVRPFPAERLRKELQLFVHQQIAQIWVLDSTFNAPPERGKKLLELLLEIAPHIHYHIEAKVDFLDTDTIELLSRLSCSVQIGLQSAGVQILQPLHRKFAPKQMEKKLKQMTRAGITFGLDLIYGLPGDNHAGFQNSLNFALYQQPNQVDIFPLAVLPGTELFAKQEYFGIQGNPDPPYLLQKNKTYSPADLSKSRWLAAATDIFYNRGRAVGFFLQLCQALKLSPSIFLQQFADWLSRQQNIEREYILASEGWQPKAILSLQQQYIADQLSLNKQPRLISVAEDLLNYHFFCAEALLTVDCQPDQGAATLQQQLWCLNPAVKVQQFHFVLEKLEMVGGESLEEMYKQLTIEPGWAIFLRQQGEVIAESLDTDLALILNRAKQEMFLPQLSQGIDLQVADELLDFAVTQGLLLPVKSI